MARLELSAEEERLYAAQLADVVRYIDQLERFAPDGVVSEPSAAPVERADEPAAVRLAPADWLENAPAVLDHFVLVPQVKKSD